MGTSSYPFDDEQTHMAAVRPSRDWKLICLWALGMLGLVGMLVCVVH